MCQAISTLVDSSVEVPIKANKLVMNLVNHANEVGCHRLDSGLGDFLARHFDYNPVLTAVNTLHLIFVITRL